MQSPRELIAAMFNKTTFDRVGVDEGFWPETLDAWIAQGYPTRVVVENQIEKQIPVDSNDYFGFDLRKCGGFFDTEPLLGIEEVVQETEEWIIKRNGSGATFKWWKYKSGTPEHVDFKMNSREIWESEYRPHLLGVDYRRFNGKWWEPKTLEDDRQDLQLAHQRDRWAWYGHVFVWEVLRSSLGDLSMYENLLLDPGWVLDFNKVYTNFFKAHYELLFKENGLPDGVWVMDDLAYKNGLFASPKVMEKLFLPFYADIVDFFHGYDLPVVFHSDGNITAALPLLVEAGFQGLNPMEVKAGCDLLAFAKTYRDHLVFIGGLDVRILETNDRDLIRKEVIRWVEGMKAIGAPYVFGSDHTITPLVHFDSYRYALEIYQQHRNI